MSGTRRSEPHPASNPARLQRVGSPALPDLRAPETICTMSASGLGNIGGPEALLRHRSGSVRSSGPLLRASNAARPASLAFATSVNSGMRPSGGSDTNDVMYRPFTGAKWPRANQTPSSTAAPEPMLHDRPKPFPFNAVASSLVRNRLPANPAGHSSGVHVAKFHTPEISKSVAIAGPAGLLARKERNQRQLR